MSDVAVDRPKIVEGQLSKYTNVIQGWQNRWFILKPDSGILEYFMGEEFKKYRPRGRIQLEGATISPSVEDSHTFSVSSQTGDTFKLRASDAKERQHWVNILRTVAEQHGLTQSKLYVNSGQQQSDKGSPLSRGSSPSRQLSETLPLPNNSTSSRAQQRVMCNSRSLYDAFSAAQEMLLKVEQNHQLLAKAIEDLPSSRADFTCNDHELLLMKATSQATSFSLKQCLGMLQHQQQAASFHMTGVTGGTTTEFLEPASSFYIWSKTAEPQVPNPSIANSTMQEIPIPVQETAITVGSEDEVTDDEEFSDSDILPADEQKSAVLQLLSQLKLGMDLTHVILPTFMLEPRSLLEMFADFMSHPDMFLRTTAEPTAELRILAILQWYLCTFYAGKPVSSGKKPYNPILGEVFLCSWHVPHEQDLLIQDAEEAEADAQRFTKVRFVAEQVSHHPPVTAFYVSCPEKKIHLNAHIWTKSKFMGMAIGVGMVGEAVLRLDEHDEEYVITFPSAYARSILSLPWVELGGKVGISCSKTGISASVTFHTKPFYGGKVHRITAEVKNSLGTVLCKVQGEWNKVLEFTYGDGRMQQLDATNIPKYKKKLRPLIKQCAHESRVVWQRVTKALHEGDTATATHCKQLIEEQQRIRLQNANKIGVPHAAHFFQPSGEGWQYKDLQGINPSS